MITKSELAKYFCLRQATYTEEQALDRFLLCIKLFPGSPGRGETQETRLYETVPTQEK